MMPVRFLSWTLLTQGEKTGVADSRRKVMNSILISLSLFSVSQAQYVKCNTRRKNRNFWRREKYTVFCILTCRKPHAYSYHNELQDWSDRQKDETYREYGDVIKYS